MSNTLWIFRDFLESFKELIIAVVILAVVIFLIAIIKKTKHGGLILVIVLSVVTISLGAITGYANYRYLTAEGGTWGSFGNLFTGKNEMFQNGMSFEIKSFQLISSGVEDEFVAKISIKNVDVSMKDKAVYFNNSPTKLISKSDSYIFVSYSYTFFDENLVELASDTLTLKFVFNTKTSYITKTDKSGEQTQQEIKDDYSYLLLVSNGGLKKARYWNKYIEKNTIKIEIKTQDFVADENMSIEESQGSENARNTIKYYVNNELYSIVEFDEDKTENLISYPIEDGNMFFGWFSSVPTGDLKTLTPITQVEFSDNKEISLYGRYFGKGSRSEDGYSDSILELEVKYIDIPVGNHGVIVVEYFDEDLGVNKSYSYGLQQRTITIKGLRYGTYTITIKTTAKYKAVNPTIEVTLGYQSHVKVPIKIVSSNYTGITDEGSI